ncbi:unnamed protein product [Brugia timori]|uniref:Uncharacterized protein n=1 Tax=Brugia timori TaxID=42155 RepID=A0A0R3QF36_9BILA|nr:unnamed protein product [Brugia timori]
MHKKDANRHILMILYSGFMSRVSCLQRNVNPFNHCPRRNRNNTRVRIFLLQQS